MLEHQSLPENVRDVLRRRILNNELLAGVRLVEAALAAELGVSRATVREAIRALAAEGLVEISPRRHSVVTRMSEEDADDVCFARYVLEAGIAKSLTAQDKVGLDEALAAALDRMDEAAAAGDLQALVEADVHFHGLIVHASGRRRAVELWNAVNGQIGALMRASIDRQHLALAGVRARHEPVRQVLAAGTARQVEKAIYAHYVTDRFLVPTEPENHA
ncbi:MAG: GntR family transcriptional regulator [Janthinobacterium lividum]